MLLMVKPLKDAIEAAKKLAGVTVEEATYDVVYVVFHFCGVVRAAVCAGWVSPEPAWALKVVRRRQG
jgi:hypothetical protein